MIALSILRFMLKMLKEKKTGLMGTNISMGKLTPIFLIPKTGVPIPIKKNESELLLENKRVIYKCGICKQKFILRSDKNISHATFMAWMSEVKGHACYGSKEH